jgi:hypothetical protein
MTCKDTIFRENANIRGCLVKMKQRFRKIKQPFILAKQPFILVE